MSLISEGADFRGPLTARLAEPSLASVGDYIALMKPRVMSLVVFTALVGLAVAPGSLHPLIGFTALLCIAVGAGAAGALNMWYDADIDAIMTRTQRRPVPMGRIQPGEALAFGLTLSGFAVVVLGLLVNVLASALLAFTIFFYVVIYTVWLKRSTPQNIVIGGAADHDVLRGRAFEPDRIDHDIEEDGEGEQRGGEHIHQQAEHHHRERGERQPEGERLAWLHAAHRHRTARGARHHRIDVGIV